jgi:glycosyltransferase involved in cell wall biosynthesis
LAIKVLLLTNTMAPYRTSVLNELAQSVDFDVWYLQEREGNRNWNIDKQSIKYKYRCLSGFHTYIQSLDFGVHINFFVFYKLALKSPDVIIVPGYDAIAYWTALLYSRIFKRKIVVWWGSTLDSSKVKNAVFNYLRRFFFSIADSFVTYGSEATQCLIHYGVKPSKVITGYNTVDVGYYYEVVGKVRSKSTQINKPLVKFLFVGQLISRKGLEETFSALSRIVDLTWELTVVGSGPLEETCRSKVVELGIAQKVKFEGYKQSDELVANLRGSDVLLFPSISEVWGLVVNEALVSNIFCLSSKYAGCTRDLIVEGKNGITIDPLDIDDYVRKLKWAIDNIDFVRNCSYTPLSVWKKMHTKRYSNSILQSIRRSLL